jgi:Na+-driven multidrug efflux pump
LLSIPLWGFSSGANTLISNLIGQDRYRDVLPATFKTGKLCLVVTMILAIPILTYPKVFLMPLLGAGESAIMAEAQPIFYLLLALLLLSTFGSVTMNALAGTGATLFGLKMQACCVAAYLVYIYFITNHTHLGLIWVWTAEILYWLVMLGMGVWYLRTYRWRKLRI